MEIERKFLIKDIGQLDLSKYERKTITQDYLYFDKLSIVRKRKVEMQDRTKYTYTIKTDKKGIGVNEIEKEIDENTYNSLEINPKYITLCKDRYIIPYNDYKIELDVFKGFYDGVIFAEIEFNDEETAMLFELPDWFGIEISETITNADMAVTDIRYKIKTM